MKSSQEIDFSFGNGPSVGAKLNRTLTSNIFANVSGEFGSKGTFKKATPSLPKATLSYPE